MVFVLYLFLSVDFYGNSAAKAIKEQAPIELRFSDNERIQGQYIGKTRATLFLWEGEQVRAIPLQAFVKDFTIQAMDQK